MAFQHITCTLDEGEPDFPGRSATAELVLFAMPAAAGFMRQLCSLGWP